MDQKKNKVAPETQVPAEEKAPETKIEVEELDEGDLSNVSGGSKEFEDSNGNCVC